MRDVRGLAHRVAAALALPSVLRLAQRRSLLIVNYHGVREDASPTRSWLLVPMAELRAQLTWLARAYEVLPVDDAITALRQGRLRRPTACITFDDGYRNNLTLAAPLLHALGLPATVFVATGYIGTAAMLWTTRLQRAVAVTPASAIDAEDLDLGRLLLTDATAREHAGRLIAARLKQLDPASRDQKLAALHARIGESPPDPQGEFAFLTWDEIARMRQAGRITFSAHTVHHEILGRLDSPSLEREVSESVRRLRDLGETARTFAYPNGQPGDFDRRAFAVLEQCGVTAALSTIEGLNDPQSPPFALRRIVVGPGWSLPQFQLKCAGITPLLRIGRGRPDLDGLL